MAAPRVGGYLARRGVSYMWRRGRRGSRRRGTRRPFHGGQQAGTQRTSTYATRRNPVLNRIANGRGTGESKRKLITANGLLDTRELYVTNLINIPKATVEGERSARERNVINISGIKICLEITSNVDRQPLYFHMAIVSQKGQTTTVTKTDFFRNDGVGTERGTDFDIGLSAQEFDCLAINNDRYNVVKHTKILLDGNNNGQYSTNGSTGTRSYKSLHTYLPIKRQFRWNADTNNNPESDIFLLYWLDGFGAAAASPSVLSVAQVDLHAVIYFKEPCC